MRFLLYFLLHVLSDSDHVCYAEVSSLRRSAGQVYMQMPRADPGLYHYKRGLRSE